MATNGTQHIQLRTSLRGRLDSQRGRSCDRSTADDSVGETHSVPIAATAFSVTSKFSSSFAWGRRTSSTRWPTTCAEISQDGGDHTERGETMSVISTAESCYVGGCSYAFVYSIDKIPLLHVCRALAIKHWQCRSQRRSSSGLQIILHRRGSFIGGGGGVCYQKELTGPPRQPPLRVGLRTTGIVTYFLGRKQPERKRSLSPQSLWAAGKQARAWRPAVYRTPTPSATSGYPPVRHGVRPRIAAVTVKAELV